MSRTRGVEEGMSGSCVRNRRGGRVRTDETRNSSPPHPAPPRRTGQRKETPVTRRTEDPSREGTRLRECDGRPGEGETPDSRTF